MRSIWRRRKARCCSDVVIAIVAGYRPLLRSITVVSNAGQPIALRLLYETAVWPAYPSDARGVPEPEDGTANGQAGVEGEAPEALGFLARHDRAERFGVGVTVTCRAVVPAEFGFVDRLGAAVHYAHPDDDAFLWLWPRDIGRP